MTRSCAAPFSVLPPVLLVVLVVSLAGFLPPIPAEAQDVSSCTQCTCTGDGDGDGSVSIAELVSVVNNALDGCPQLRWYLDCRPQVPGNQVCPPGVVFCTGEEAGESCTEPQETCCLPGSLCAGGECNNALVCTDDDPRTPPGAQCRIVSRRPFKHDIEYLSQSDLKRLGSKVLEMNLARFRYNGEASSTEPHLGFIIEDVEPSPSVDSQGDAVDLYGYISMAVATIQVQNAEIQALRRELDEIQLRISRPSEVDSQ